MSAAGAFKIPTTGRPQHAGHAQRVADVSRQIVNRPPGRTRNRLPRQYTRFPAKASAQIGICRTSLTGASQSVPIEGGKLLLGRWQGIFFCEFDGPRERRLHVKIVADSK
jgi:hypothetical protein